MLGLTVLNIFYVVTQSLSQVFALIALFTNNWISGVMTDDAEDRYFKKVTNIQVHSYITEMNTQGGEFDSIGLWKVNSDSSTSFPLPITETPLRMAIGGFLTQITLGTFALCAAAFQIFGFFTKNQGLEVFMGWCAFIQLSLVVSCTAAAMAYFKREFDYDNFGFSMYAGWISMVCCLLLVGSTIFKLRYARIVYAADLEKKKHMVKENTIVKPVTAESRLYSAHTGSRPGTARGDSRPGTMQSQQHYEPGMRRAASYENRLQSDMHDYRAPSSRGPASPRAGGRQQGYADFSYDEGDIPKHMR